MEGMVDVAYTENGVSGDETRTFNESTVLLPSIDSGVRSDGQILTDHLASNISPNSSFTNEEYNGTSPIYEGSKNYEDLLNDCTSTLVGNESNSVSKIVPPTIFENAVKVVKNLFSPAKGHGIFSRGTTQAVLNENDLKKDANEEIQAVSKSLMFGLDEEGIGKISPITNTEINVTPMEEDVSNLTMKNSSNSLSVHDNTNDSYTTTVSRMDESFQSTITHFDENMKNDSEKVNEPVLAVENCMDGSLNETMKSNENFLDNTVKKNLSICSTVNGDLNGTFEAPINNKVEDEFNLAQEDKIAPTQPLDPVLPVTESPENQQEINTLASVSEENFLSFQEEGMLKIGTFSSTPSKRNSSKKVSPSDKSFSNSVLEKDQECCQMNGENVENLKSGTDLDATKLSRHSSVNQSSENEFSFFSLGNMNGFPEKSSTPKSADFQKTFSNSTTILTKNAPETLDFSSVKEEKEAITGASDHAPKKDESGMLDETHCIKSAILEKKSQELSSNIFEKNILSHGVENSTISGEAARQDSLEMEQKVDQILAQSLPLESNSSEDVHNSSLKVAVANVDLNHLNLTINVEVDQLKGEGYSADETTIPLASQKSYTVLHNINPDLNRPIVLDYMCDVQAEKLNDIILGNCAFSDLGVFNNCSEELISDGSKNAAKMSDSNGLIPCAKPDETESNNLTFESGIPGKQDVEEKTAQISGEISDVLIHTKREFDIGEVFPMLEKQSVDSSESTADNVSSFDQAENVTTVNSLSQTDTIIPKTEPNVAKSESIVDVYHGPLLATENSSETNLVEVKEGETSLASSSGITALGDGIQNASCSEQNTSALQFCGDGGLTSAESTEPLSNNEQIVEKDSIVLSSSAKKTEVSDFQTEIEKMTSDLERLEMNDSMKNDSTVNCNQNNDTLTRFNDSLVSSEQSTSCENAKNLVKGPISGSDAELTQFIQEQFTAFDIEKICSVVDDIPELNLSKTLVIASQQFDKSFQEKTVIESGSSKANNFLMADEKFLSSALDFLDSIKGKPSGRDFSRESLYIKFDPLVQSKHSTGLLDIPEGDKENLIISPGPKNTGVNEPLIPITPLKQTINVSSPLSPLTPVTQKNEPKLSNEKLNKIKELQNEIARSREMLLQMEETNKEKMNNYEREIAKLTGRACILEDKLKESEEMEKSLVKKLNVQNESVNRLKNILEDHLAYIEKLTNQIELERMESRKKINVLTEERDCYVNHLHNVEQAFSDVHSKYEKCKKTLEMYKNNEDTYKTSIEDFKERIDQYREKIKDIQENAAKEMNRLQEKMSEMKADHTQEISRFKAQLRKTELKAQTIQEALDQKVKENQELARICDELIDGKKRNC